jgi:hypothetical protein
MTPYGPSQQGGSPQPSYAQPGGFAQPGQPPGYAQQPEAPDPYPQTGGAFQNPSSAEGLRALWIDDDFASGDVAGTKRELLDRTRQRGIHVETASDLISAQRALQLKPDLVVSEITRYGNQTAGFDDLSVLRDEGSTVDR